MSRQTRITKPGNTKRTLMLPASDYDRVSEVASKVDLPIVKVVELMVDKFCTVDQIKPLVADFKAKNSSAVSKLIQTLKDMPEAERQAILKRFQEGSEPALSL